MDGVRNPAHLSEGEMAAGSATSGGYPLAGGAAWVTYVRSPFTHARIVSIDVAEALLMPGVLGIVTADGVEFPPNASSPMPGPAEVGSALVASEVHSAGEAVAAVVTEERSQGPDAAELVAVKYELLPEGPDDCEGDDGSSSSPHDQSIEATGLGW